MINEKIKNYGLYYYGTVKTEEQLKKAVALAVMEVCTSDYDFYNKIANKNLYIDDFIEACMPCLQLDISQKSNVYTFLNCAKDFYNLPDLKSVLYKIYKELAEYIEEDGTKLFYTVSDVFDIIETHENLLVLPEKWLSNQIYKKITEFLKSFNWIRTKYKKCTAFKNQGDFTNEQILKIGKSLKGVTLSEKFDFYPTPDELSEKIKELAEIKKDDFILEPSAGMGSLIKGLNKNNIVCVELSPISAEILKNSGYDTKNIDFMEYQAKRQFDKILMNPPFSKNMDAKHITHAFNMLKNGGVLVAVHTPTIKTAENKACKDFQKIFNQYAVSSETFSGAVKNSGKGTNINVCITKFIKE